VNMISERFKGRVERTRVVVSCYSLAGGKETTTFAVVACQ